MSSNLISFKDAKRKPKRKDINIIQKISVEWKSEDVKFVLVHILIILEAKTGFLWAFYYAWI